MNFQGGGGQQEISEVVNMGGSVISDNVGSGGTREFLDVIYKQSL